MVPVTHVDLTPKSQRIGKLAHLMHVEPDKAYYQMVPVKIAQIMRELKVKGEDVVQTHASHDKS